MTARAASSTGGKHRRTIPGFSQLQRIGRSLMLPIASLPVAALLLRFGAADVLGADGLSRHVHWMQPVADVLAAAGGAIFDNLPLIFALGVAVGYAKKADGSTALAALIGYLVFTGAGTSKTTQGGVLGALAPYFAKDTGVINYGVLGGIVIGIIALVTVFLAAWAEMGIALPIIAGVFLLYCFFGQYAPGLLQTRGYDAAQVIEHMAYGTEGIYGIPTYVSSSYIFLFILFGAFLEKAGMIKLFTDVSLGLVGHLLGGPAKVAVFSSALMGTKIVLNEFVAFIELGQMTAAQLSDRSRAIVTFALCGFANFSSIAIQMAVTGGLAPNQRPMIAKLGIRARIFMPHGVALPKLQATRDHGAEVVLHGSTVDESLAEAQRWATETGAVFIPPFDDPAVIAGQGTVGLEILDVLPDVDTVIMGIGGGGLIAGTAVALKEAARRRGRTVRVIGVQAATAAAFPGSLEEGRVQVLESVSTIADGIAVGRPGALPLRIAAELVDAVVTVTDDEIAAALVHLLERSKLVVEPAGAVGVAALLAGRTADLGFELGTTAVILSGGNIDPMLMLKSIQAGLSAAGRYMTVRIPLRDRPGELATISRIIADTDANVVRVDHTRVGPELSMGGVHITIDMETRGAEHSGQVLEALRAAGYSPAPLP